MAKTKFEWDPKKDELNFSKHGVSFFVAQKAFFDPNRVIAEDIEHSLTEKRYYCFGKIDGEVMTVRFVYKDQIIRFFGAGYWRKGRRIYEKAQS